MRANTKRFDRDRIEHESAAVAGIAHVVDSHATQLLAFLSFRVAWSQSNAIVALRDLFNQCRSQPKKQFVKVFIQRHII